jgi:ABC transport system ATP-binding/permease protein
VSALSRLLGLPQASILTSRYIDLKLGDPLGLLLLLLQAPLIGWLTGLAFENKAESKTLDFILAIVAVWFGCFNACREVVKERLIFLRERRAGVSARAYLLSKLLVLSLLAVVQCLVLLVFVARAVRMESSLPLAYAALLSTCLTATALGLLISSVVTSQNAAMAIVPIVLIPQLIFSEATLGPTRSPVVKRVEKAMVASWGHEALTELLKDKPAWSDILKAEAVLASMAVGFLLLAGLSLRMQEE